MDYTLIIIELAIVLGSLTVHEAAHAWSADRLGDPTARLLGRTSFNPLVHIDLIGTVVLPLMLALSGLPVFGWAKPVPVNVSQLRHPRRDFALVAAAGPGSNVALAVLGAIAVRVLAGGDITTIPMPLLQLVAINIFLAVFNLVPVPPLDGGNVLAALLPRPAAGVFAMIRPYGFIVLLVMVYTNALDWIVTPPSYFLIRLLLP